MPGMNVGYRSGYFLKLNLAANPNILSRRPDTGRGIDHKWHDASTMIPTP